MSKFSVFNYENLSDSMKADFNKALATELSSMRMEIKADEVLGTIGVEEFVVSEGKGQKSATLVADLYSKISAGIQAGSGNQNLFQAVLCAFTDSWNQISSKL